MGRNPREYFKVEGKKRVFDSQSFFAYIRKRVKEEVDSRIACRREESAIRLRVKNECNSHQDISIKIDEIDGGRNWLTCDLEGISRTFFSDDCQYKILEIIEQENGRGIWINKTSGPVRKDSVLYVPLEPNLELAKQAGADIYFSRFSEDFVMGELRQDILSNRVAFIKKFNELNAQRKVWKLQPLTQKGRVFLHANRSYLRDPIIGEVFGSCNVEWEEGLLGQFWQMECYHVKYWIEPGFEDLIASAKEDAERQARRLKQPLELPKRIRYARYEKRFF